MVASMLQNSRLCAEGSHDPVYQCSNALGFLDLDKMSVLFWTTNSITENIACRYDYNR